MTSLANDQGFTPVLEHDLRPKRLISSHRGQIGKSAHLMNHALLVFDGAEFAGARYESSDHLPSLIGSPGGDLSNDSSLWVRVSAEFPQSRPLAVSCRCLAPALPLGTFLDREGCQR